MSIITLNNLSINRSDTASSGQVWTATSATAADFQAAGIIEEIDMWAPTADAQNFTTIGVNDASSDLTVARHSGSNFTHKGTGMSTNNTYWTFPSTGYWYVSLKAQWRLEGTASCRGMTSRIDVSTDGGSSFNDNYGLSMLAIHTFDSNNDFGSTDATCVIDVDNVSNVKVRGFYTSANASNEIDMSHDEADQSCGWTFIKLRGV